ncbi:MAG TPA: SDR family oxidoreductase [Anaerolineales bacterium]|nr:SDR family oxidoreductase [Anaerolineales bacterium]
MDLNGRSAVVTGGAHRVGRAIALALAERGCSLVVHYHRSREAAEQTAKEAERLGVRATPIGADLRQLGGVHGLFEHVDRAFDRLDVLVNSAAILEPVDLLAASEADWQSTIDLNLKAAFFCLQAAARRMHSSGGGAVVNISDVAGQRAWSRYPIHSISKAGLDMLTRTAALALAPDIRVNGVAPGPVEKPAGMTDLRWREIGGALPLRRPGTAADVAAAVVFCLENEYLVGETIPVDGGDLVS